MDLARRARERDGRRVVGIDVARCLALVGMMATHMLPGYDGGDVTWHQQLAGGRSSALFAVLAGVSLGLMSGRRQPQRGSERLATSAGLVARAAVIAGIGLVLGSFDSGLAVILTYYGVLFVFGLPFLGLRAPALAALSVVWLLVVPVVSQLVRPHLPEPSMTNPNLSSLATPWQLLTELTFTGYYPAVPWLAYLLAGMAVARLDLRSARTGAVLLLVGLSTAVTASVVSWTLTRRPDAASALRSTYDPDFTPTQSELEAALEHGLYGVTPTGSWWWLTVVSPHTATPFDLAQTIGSALVVIGLALIVTRRATRLFAVLFGAGAMTLTLYSAHVLMRTPEIWPSPDEGVSSYQTHLVVVLGTGIVFALLRLRGPLEAVSAACAAAVAGTVRVITRPSDTSVSSGGDRWS
jgi:uncharacterized membrane protein